MEIFGLCKMAVVLSLCCFLRFLDSLQHCAQEDQETPPLPPVPRPSFIPEQPRALTMFVEGTCPLDVGDNQRQFHSTFTLPSLLLREHRCLGSRRSVFFLHSLPFLNSNHFPPLLPPLKKKHWRGFARCLRYGAHNPSTRKLLWVFLDKGRRHAVFWC